MFKAFHNFRRGLERRLVSRPAEAFWKKTPVISLERSHELIRSAIDQRKPYCVGRLGGVEQKIILWGKNIPLVGRFGLRLPVLYSDTRDGAPNAGVRPRTKESYQTFADLAFESLKTVDLLPTWKTAGEYAVLRKLTPAPVYCEGEQLSPTVSNDGLWVESLDKKRVLVISPFKSSIEKQITRMDRVWSTRPWKWRAEFLVKKFPYLIDDDCPLSWQEVWSEMSSLLRAGDYDVALFGCGGLGLPLAAEAKAAGRVGIHLGGHLQLLFGIYGQRHLEQEWHARWIQDAWIRPAPDEVAKTAQRVENGCYW